MVASTKGQDEGGRGEGVTIAESREGHVLHGGYKTAVLRRGREGSGQEEEEEEKEEEEVEEGGSMHS